MPPAKIQKQTFNVGFENHTVSQLANIVADVVGQRKKVNLIVEPTNDNRSYHISSEKIAKELGFSTQFTIKNAVEDLCQAFDEGKLPDALTGPQYFNIKRMQEVHLS